MSDSTTILQTCFALAALWAFWHYGWSQFMLDMYRQRLFSIRDELFDLAARGDRRLSFDHPAYIELRGSLNTSIRFAHRISFYHVWIGSFLGTLSGRLNQMRNHKSKAALTIEGISDSKLKEDLNALVRRETLALGCYMVLRSPVFIACMAVGGIFAILTILVKKGIFGSVKVFLRAVEEQIKVRELEPSARAVQFQTDAMNQSESDLCPA